MFTFDRLVYVTVSAVALAYGLLTLWILPPPDQILQCDELLGKNPLITAIIIGFCIIVSGTVGCIMAYNLRHLPHWLLTLIKLFYVALLAIGGAGILSLVLDWFGLVRLAPFSKILWIFSVSEISAGLAGVMTMKSIPEYREIFPRWCTSPRIFNNQHDGNKTPPY